jgi:molecular chaperone GrpE
MTDTPENVGAGDADIDASPPNATETQPPSPEITTSSDTDALQRDLAAASEKHLRLAAEFDNYRRRNERERADAWGRAQSELAKNLLDPIDDLERVAHHAAGEVNYQALLEGVQLVEKKLRSSLTAAGLEFIDAAGAAFDPKTMEAVAMVPTDVPEEDDTVSDVFQRGYSFKGQLLRPARVRVKKYEG